MSIAPLCGLCGSNRMRPTSLEKLHRCADCGAYLNWRSGDRAEEEGRYLEESFDRSLVRSQQQFAWFGQALAAIPGGHLLDFGCGTGGFLALAQSAGWQVSGLEINPASAERAASILKGPVFCGSFYDYPGAEQEFDAITFWDTLDHLMEPLDGLRLARQWLKPGGALVIRVRNGPWHFWARFLQFWLRKLGIMRDRGSFFGVIHRYGFQSGSLKGALLRAGFTDVRIQPARLNGGDPGTAGSWWRQRLVEFVFGANSVIYRLSGGRLYLFPSIFAVCRKPLT